MVDFYNLQFVSRIQCLQYILLYIYLMVLKMLQKEIVVLTRVRAFTSVRFCMALWCYLIFRLTFHYIELMCCYCRYIRSCTWFCFKLKSKWYIYKLRYTCLKGNIILCRVTKKLERRKINKKCRGWFEVNSLYALMSKISIF